MALSRPQAAPTCEFARWERRAEDGDREGVGWGKRQRRSALPSAEAPGSHHQVAATVGDAIVPRLVLTGRCMERGGVGQPDESLAAMVESLARRSLHADPAEIVTWAERRHAEGRTVETLYMDLLAPVAAQLRRWVGDDICTAAEATLALSCLHRVLHALAPAFYEDAAQPIATERALWAALPRAQADSDALFDCFEVALTAEFFRRAGWDVWADSFRSRAALTELVRKKRFALVGLVVREDADLEDVGRVVHAVRQASRNRDLGILLAGPAVQRHPERAVTVGADAAVSDARHAVKQAAELGITSVF